MTLAFSLWSPQFWWTKNASTKNMVTGLPHFTGPLNICEDCTINKQHRMSFQKGKIKRAKQYLEIVHSNICRPINPFSSRGKHCIITLIDDLSRKT